MRAVFWLYVLAILPPKNIGRESDQMQRAGGHAGPDSPGWARARGWRIAVYENSLLLAMTFLFVAAWAAQSVAD